MPTDRRTRTGLCPDRSPLPDILLERHAAQKPTWVTTGLTREQLVKRYSTGIVSRLFDQTKVLRLESPEASEP